MLIRRSLQFISNCLELIPVASTFSSIIETALKCLYVDHIESTRLQNHTFGYLADKSYARKFILVIPVLGNTIIILSDLIRFGYSCFCSGSSSEPIKNDEFDLNFQHPQNEEGNHKNENSNFSNTDKNSVNHFESNKNENYSSFPGSKTKKNNSNSIKGTNKNEKTFTFDPDSTFEFIFDENYKNTKTVNNNNNNIHQFNFSGNTNLFTSNNKKKTIEETLKFTKETHSISDIQDSLNISDEEEEGFLDLFSLPKNKTNEGSFNDLSLIGFNNHSKLEGFSNEWTIGELIYHIHNQLQYDPTDYTLTLDKKNLFDPRVLNQKISSIKIGRVTAQISYQKNDFSTKPFKIVVTLENNKEGKSFIEKAIESLGCEDFCSLRKKLCLFTQEFYQNNSFNENEYNSLTKVLNSISGYLNTPINSREMSFQEYGVISENTKKAVKLINSWLAVLQAIKQKHETKKIPDITSKEMQSFLGIAN